MNKYNSTAENEEERFVLLTYRPNIH